MQIPLSQKTILITGASSGIGYELAKAYLQQGECVIVLARSQNNLNSLVERFPETCIAVAVDLTDKDSALAAGKTIAECVGSIDIAILNAGTCEYVDAKAFSLEPFEKVMAINWQGTLNTLVFALPLLRKAAVESGGKCAQLVGVSSMASLLPMPRSEAYGASKVALEYLFNSLRVDLGKENIHISIVRPGFVKTPLTDRNDFAMPFIITPAQAAEKIIKGIGARKWIIQFPWPLVAIMRAISWLPMCWQTSLLQKISRDETVKQ